MNKILFGLVAVLTIAFSGFITTPVEALPATTNLCGAASATFPAASNPIYSNCSTLANTVTFNFNYDFDVTGFSSGSDGY